MTAGANLLEIEDLSTWIETAHGIVRAVDGLSLTVRRGETYALLGESGCGKSVTALSVMRLLPEQGRVVGGSVRLDGQDLLELPEARMRELRGGRVGMIFQEPMLSLNPVLTVGAQIAEVLVRHTDYAGEAAVQRATQLLDSVGVPDAPRRLAEYPFQLSGGLRQRVMIAMALACEPELLIADEPTTALDVTIQAQVLDLLRDLQAARGLSVLLITHDLAVVAQMAHRVAVMYAGQLVEEASREAFFARPAHPYSRKLFDSVPTRGKRGADLAVIRGSVPALTQSFRGCRFAERCDSSWEHCRRVAPRVLRLAQEHVARCHLHDQTIERADVTTLRSAQSVAMGGHTSPGGREPGAEAAATAGLAAERASEATPAPGSIQPADSAGETSNFERAPAPGGLLDVRDLAVHFPIQKGIFRRTVAHVKAVDGISLSIPRGRTLALVGESGCGKTTAGKAILQLIASNCGTVLFDGEDIGRLRPRELRAKRRGFQIVFQDPFASLDPRMRVAEILSEGMEALGVGDDAAGRLRRIDRLLEEVGLDPAAKMRYPHEFSGGQRQRVAIARALAVEPQLVVCDEPTSALDVSVQAQILNLLMQLQRRHGIAYLFITHNMAVVEYLAHEVAVMYLGRIVEHAPVQALFATPRHPYTRALLSAVPTIDGKQMQEAIRLEGDIPSPVTPPSGCHFHPRCGQALPQCREHYPPVITGPQGHTVRCHLYPAA